jgi:hypothetical protein
MALLDFFSSVQIYVRLGTPVARKHVLQSLPKLNLDFAFFAASSFLLHTHLACSWVRVGLSYPSTVEGCTDVTPSCHCSRCFAWFTYWLFSLHVNTLQQASSSLTNYNGTWLWYGKSWIGPRSGACLEISLIDMHRADCCSGSALKSDPTAPPSLEAVVEFSALLSPVTILIISSHSQRNYFLRNTHLMLVVCYNHTRILFLL